MRNNIVHPGASELVYEIRKIVEVANQISKTGISITWENIGDPVSKGEKVPQWIKEIIVETIVSDDSSFGYSPTKGLLSTREYISRERNLEGGVQITPDDILFFNGLGDAISTLYTYLHKSARVIGPNPAYSTHSSAEAAHANAPHITYRLDPNNNWFPDIEDLKRKIKSHTEISGILIVNPDNPTGMVFPEKVMKEIVEIARVFDLFIISDEIYSNLTFSDTNYKKIAAVIGDVPAIAMRGISKEFPWPGARCGWIEFYNRDKDASFARYTKSLIDAKMLEVCSTTLPQKVLPKIMANEKYYPYLKERTEKYSQKSHIAFEIFSAIPELTVYKAQGAFYMTILFKEGVLNKNQKLSIANKEAEKIVEPYFKGDKLDSRFVYYLLASRGICVVPLSTGFNSNLEGFRITLLEPDIEKFKRIMVEIAKAIVEYIAQ